MSQIYKVSSGSGGSGIITIDGDIGSVTGSEVGIKATGSSKTGSSFSFTASGSDLDLISTDSNGNIFLGAGVPFNSDGGSSNNVIISGDGTAGATFSASNGNVGIGAECFDALTTGDSNCAFGMSALTALQTGSLNIACGLSAGSSYTNAESSNICLNSSGVVGDNHTLRIGAATGIGSGELNKAYICGITGTNLSTTQLVTNVADQLGSATLVGGTGVTIGTSGSTIVVNVATGGFTWSLYTGTTVIRILAQSGSIPNDDSNLVTMRLPLTANVGDIFKIVGRGLGGWKLEPSTAQVIHLGTQTTTSGTSGSISSTNQYDSVEVICVVANAEYVCTDVVGNLTVV